MDAWPSLDSDLAARGVGASKATLRAQLLHEPVGNGPSANGETSRAAAIYRLMALAGASGIDIDVMSSHSLTAREPERHRPVSAEADAYDTRSAV